MPSTMESREVRLTRLYSFSAAHSLHSPYLTEDENRRLFGKCGRPAGHGHNYILRVTVKGPVDPATGMVVDVSLLDDIVKKHALDPLDHKNLNVELETLPILTTEMLIKEIWSRLKLRLQRPDLIKIEIDETRKNGFGYCGE